MIFFCHVAPLTCEGPGRSRGGHRPAPSTDLAAVDRHGPWLAGEADAAHEGEGGAVASTRDISSGFLGNSINMYKIYEGKSR